jgi:hypothetical protein
VQAIKGSSITSSSCAVIEFPQVTSSLYGLILKLIKPAINIELEYASAAGQYIKKHIRISDKDNKK